MASLRDSDPSDLEKFHGHGTELEEFASDGVNHHSYDNHTSFNKYPTHEPGFENKVSTLLWENPGGCSSAMMLTRLASLHSASS